MSGSGSEPLFPDWTRDATAASLRERREVLEGRLGRLAEPLRESTSPRFAELHALRDSLASLPEARPWRERAQALTVAQEQRQAHVASSQRGRRLALVLAAGVLALSVAGWAAKRPRPMAPSTRTTLRGQRIHTAGLGVGVAGRGIVTLAGTAQPGLRIHQGQVEVSAQGSAQVTVAVGPHTVEVRGGRVEVAREGGETTVRAAEGQVMLFTQDGEARMLEAGGPPWTGPSPEEAETCSAGVEEATSAVLGGGPAGLSDPKRHLLHLPAGGTAGLGSLPGTQSGEVGATRPALVPAPGTFGPSPAAASLQRGPPTLSLDADYRPWTPPHLVRTNGGERGRIAASSGSSAQDARAHAADAEALPSHLTSSVQGTAVFPVLDLAPEVRHTVEGSPVPMAVDPLSGLGFCPLPPPVAVPVPVPDPIGSAPAETAPTRRVETARKPKDEGAAAAAAEPTREIPALPTAQPVRPAALGPPELPGEQAFPEPLGAASEALQGVVFGLGIDGAECDP